VDGDFGIAYTSNSLNIGGAVNTDTHTVLIGLWTDNPGNIYVANYINYLIRKITPEGLVSTMAGQPWLSEELLSEAFTCIAP
jgi:hypothetical protein